MTYKHIGKPIVVETKEQERRLKKILNSKPKPVESPEPTPKTTFWTSTTPGRHY